jgi:hypothetical protein
MPPNSDLRRYWEAIGFPGVIIVDNFDPFGQRPKELSTDFNVLAVYILKKSMSI